jgi:hypothetical protein
MTSLAELTRRVLTFPGPASRIFALERVREAIEEQLAHLKSQRSVQLNARIKREARSMAKEDIEDLRYELQSTVDELFPKVFRGGFIIYLWTVFEACVKDMAEYTRREKKVPFGLHELRAGDFLEQMGTFFSRVLDLQVFPDRAVRAQLDQLKDLRAALVHHDGDVEKLPKSLRGSSPADYELKGLTTYEHLHHVYAIPTAEFARRSLETVSNYLAWLQDEVYPRVHPVPLEDDK